MSSRAAPRPSLPATPPCTQAVILVGGEGKRMRPITSRTPKPVTPLVERPFIAYILDNLVRHGVERAIFSSGYLAEAIEAAIGDGSAYGLRIDYVREAEPLGTAGAIANCADVLDDGPLFVFNGDVLSDVDLTAMAAAHAARRGAATICLTEVEEPSRYGLVLLNEDHLVAEFIEKPSTWLGPALINAGVYVLDREVLDLVPRGVEFSIERGVFPRLAGDDALYGFADAGYWRDIGTPESYLQAHFDVLAGAVRTVVGEQLDDRGQFVAPTAAIAPEARLVAPVYVGDGAVVEAGARVGPRCVLGAGARVQRGARVSESVIQADGVIGAHAEVERSVLVRGARIGAGARVTDAVLGEACEVGVGERPAAGIRLYPREGVTDGALVLEGSSSSQRRHD